ncbi:hypothetical protein Dimus_039027 [Dionaea muscipula]
MGDDPTACSSWLPKVITALLRMASLLARGERDHVIVAHQPPCMPAARSSGSPLHAMEGAVTHFTARSPRAPLPDGSSRSGCSLHGSSAARRLHEGAPLPASPLLAERFGARAWCSPDS